MESNPFIAGFQTGLEMQRMKSEQEYKQGLLSRMQKENELRDVRIRREMDAEKTPEEFLKSLGSQKQTEVPAKLPDESMDLSPADIVRGAGALPTTEQAPLSVEDKLLRYHSALAKAPDKANVLTALAMGDKDLGPHLAETVLRAKLAEIQGTEATKLPFEIAKEKAKLEGSLGKEKTLLDYKNELESKKGSNALKVVEDSDSSSGYSYQDLKGNKIPGAPAPRAAQSMTPDQATEKIQHIDKELYSLGQKGNNEALMQDPKVQEAMAKNPMLKTILSSGDEESKEQYRQTLLENRARMQAIAKGGKISTPSGGGKGKSAYGYASPADVQKAFQAGKIDQDLAIKILTTDFNMKSRGNDGVR